jgi:hypothetical protein
MKLDSQERTSLAQNGTMEICIEKFDIKFGNRKNMTTIGNCGRENRINVIE